MLGKIRETILTLINKILQNKNAKNILENFGWLFVDKALRMGVGAILSVLIARHLGPELFGKWNYAIAFTFLFGWVATLGLEGIIIRELIGYPEKINVLLGTSFLMRILSGFIAFLLPVLIIFFTNSNDYETYLLVAIVAGQFIFTSTDVIDYYFQSKVKSKYTVIAKNIAFVVFVIVKIILLILKASLLAFVWVTTAEIALSALLMLVAYKMDNQYLSQLKFDRKLSFLLLKSSLPLAMSGLVISIYMKIDQVMLGQMIGNKAVGEYSAALRLSEIWYFLPIIICSSFFPSILTAKKTAYYSYIKKMQMLFDFLTYLSLSIAIAFSIFSADVIKFLYNDNYLNSSAILSIHIWTGVFVFLGVASGQYLLSENLTRIAFYRTLSGAVINILLNLILIPKFSGQGAAWATLISQILAAYIFDLFNKSTFALFKMKTKSILLINLFIK